MRLIPSLLPPPPLSFPPSLLQYGCVCFLLALWLPDTFRKERSLAWRKARDRARQHAREKLEAARAALPRPGGDDDKAADVEGRAGRRAKVELDVEAGREEREQPSGGFLPVRKVRTALSGRSGDVKVKIRFRDINVRQTLSQPSSQLAAVADSST